MEVLYPYPVLGGPISFFIDQVLVDGQRSDKDLLAMRGMVDLTQLADWRRVVFDVRAEAPPAELRRIGAADARMTVGIRCQSTNTRISTTLNRGTRAGTWRGEVALDNGVFTDRVAMHALLVGTVDGVACRYLGTSEDASVWVDPRRLPPTDGTLPVRWADFEAADLVVLDPTFRQEPFYVELDRDPPTIWLNSKFPALRRLLDDVPGRRKVDESMRAIQFAAIGLSGWMGLFNAAVGAVVASKGEGRATWPRTEWQKQVLRLLLPKIYPDLTDEAALEKLVEDDSSEDGARTLQSRAQSAIAQHIKVGKTMHHAILALEEAK